MFASEPTHWMNKCIAHRRTADGAVQPLEQHLLGVARLSARRASKLTTVAGTDSNQATLEHVGEVLGLLHDLGKYSKEFQDYLQSAVGLIDQDADDFVIASASDSSHRCASDRENENSRCPPRRLRGATPS